jgi:hypothetical protein
LAVIRADTKRRRVTSNPVLWRWQIFDCSTLLFFDGFQTAVSPVAAPEPNNLTVPLLEIEKMKILSEFQSPSEPVTSTEFELSKPSTRYLIDGDRRLPILTITITII